MPVKKVKSVRGKSPMASARSRSPTKSAGRRKTAGAKRTKRSASSKKRAASAPPPKVDIMSVAAMENLYYISHNVPDALTKRGFPWPDAPKGKAKKSKGGKKKKK